jgi:hypothetical protein
MSDEETAAALTSPHGDGSRSLRAGRQGTQPLGGLARWDLARTRRAPSDEHQQLTAQITEYELIAASPERQRELVGTDRGGFLASYADPDGPRG